jgi:hypothetical protein
MRWVALLLLLLSAPLVAQRSRPYFHVGLGVAGGNYSFDSDLSGFDDNASAGFLMLEFEATTRKGFGGGLRYEYFVSDDEEGLFRDPNNALDQGTQARSGTLFAHATYLVTQHRFSMPVRVGLLFNGLTLDDGGSSNPESTYGSIGPLFEVEPELTLTRANGLQWSIYGQLGVGVAATSIEFDGDSRDYESTSAFATIEAGTRLRLLSFDIGLAFVGRYQGMDRSDIRRGNFVEGYDASFQGIMLSAGFSF